MSTGADKGPASPNVSGTSEKPVKLQSSLRNRNHEKDGPKSDKSTRKVSFPANDDQLVTQYFEAANPWQEAPPISREQLAAEYLDSCRKHNTPPLECVLQQIQEIPEKCIGGRVRAPRLVLAGCTITGARAADALEALLCRVQFCRIQLQHCTIDDAAAEAIFDMIEYYESTNSLAIIGQRHFGIVGWQAASRMIKRSEELTELSANLCHLEASHCSVLSRALRPAACRLVSLSLQQAGLTGDSLPTLLVYLKSNTSLRELRLGDNNLTPSDAMQLASLLKYNANLRLLDLSNNQIQDEGVYHIAKALEEQADLTPTSNNASPISPGSSPLGGSEQKGLAFLVLWNNQLTRNCTSHISQALRKTRSLCVLNIGRNALGGEGLRGLKLLGPLVCLGLQAARLGPEAGSHLAQLIGHKHLQRLDLRDNKLGSSGLQEILAAMKSNQTLTQMDLDDCAEQTSLTPETNTVEQATCARLTAEIRAICRRNETNNSQATKPPHRKMSLTCLSLACNRPPVSAPNTAAGGSESRTRLRSPAPSPAPSPTPQHSRFSVTRVTPDRESSTDSNASSPSTPTRPCSRFRVVEVIETPQIHVQPSTSPSYARRSKSSSRFSVTRNYDSIYNPSTSPTISPRDTSPRDTQRDTKHDNKSDNNTINSDSDKSTVDKINDFLKGDKSNSDKSNTDIAGCLNESATRELKCISDNASSINDDINVSFDKQIDSQIDNVVNNNSCVNNNIKIDSDVIITDKSSVETLNRTDQINDKEKSFVENKTLFIDENTFVDTSATEKVDIKIDTSVKESVSNNCNIEAPTKVTVDKPREFKNLDKIIKSEATTMKQIVAITEDLGNLIQEMKDLSMKTCVLGKKDSKINIESAHVPEVKLDVALKKIKSDSSIDSSDLEVARLIDKRSLKTCDSSSSLEVSGSSLESLDTQMKKCLDIPCAMYADNSFESDTTPVNFTTSISSTESVSLVDVGLKKNDSLSSLEASCSSIDQCKYIDNAMMTSTDSGIEYSVKNLTVNEGTLTLRDEVKPNIQSTLTPSPKRTSSCVDVPSKSKTSDRQRKISFCSPSHSFQVKTEPEKDKLSSNLEKLLSLFQHPSSLFTRNNGDEDKKSNTPPRKESSGIGSSFWSWGNNERIEVTEKDDSISENTDSTLSERVQIYYVDESFSKKLDSKSSSTDTDNTLSEFCSNPVSEISESSDKTQDSLLAEKLNREITTECENIVQNIVLSDADTSNNGNLEALCDKKDLIQPNDLNRNIYRDVKQTDNDVVNDEQKLLTKDEANVVDLKIDEKPIEIARPRSFASVLKSSGSENTIDRQTSPDPGQTVDKLSSKIIRGIKENISPENTITTSNISSLAMELSVSELHVKNTESTVIIGSLWDTQRSDVRIDEKAQKPMILSKDDATMAADKNYIDIPTTKKVLDEPNISFDSGVTSLDSNIGDVQKDDKVDDKLFDTDKVTNFEVIDLGKDALSYLIYENQDFDPDTESEINESKKEGGLVLAEELKNAEAIIETLDLSPDLIVDDVFMPEQLVLRTSPLLERTKLKKASSLENIIRDDSCKSEDESPRIKTKIAFDIPEISGTSPQDIPKARKLRSKSGSSPKSLPESFKHASISRLDHSLCKKKKKVSSLGKIAKDSLLALNMTEEEIAEFRRSYKLTSVESLKSLESVSEDAISHSNSVESRCKCLRLSQESLMSLDSITEDCKCNSNDNKGGNSSAR